MRIEVVMDAAICALLALGLWSPLGRWFLERIGKRGPPSGCSLAVAIGMAVWGNLVFFVGLVGLLYPTLLLGLAAALFLFLKLHRHFKAQSQGPEPISGKPVIDRLVIAAFALVSSFFVLLVLASAFAPEAAFDALNVLLPYARDSAASHRFSFAPNNWNSSMPAMPLMSYATAFVFSGLSLAKLFNFCCYLTAGGVIYSFVSHRWSDLHGAAAALLFWTSPVVLYEATTALVDLPVTLYSAIATFFLLDWIRRDSRSSLWLSAAGLGFALGCKYQASFWILPFMLIISHHVLKVRRWGTQRLLELLSQYALIVAILFLPWVVRAWYYTGNPIFPLANWIFKSPYFTPAMEDASMAAYRLEGVGRSWTALLMLPWTVHFHPGPFRGTLGAVFLPGTALAFLLSRSPEIRYGLCLVGVYFYEWALTLQEIRYLLPLAPLLALLTSVGFLGGGIDGSGEKLRLWAVIPHWVSRAAKYAGASIILTMAILSHPSLYPRWTKEWTYWHSYQSPFRYLIGRESSEEFLQRDVPSIYVYNFINENLTPRDRVLLLNDASQFYSRVPMLYSFSIEGENILLQETEAAVLQKLVESKITHVLLNYNGIKPLPGVSPRKGVFLFLDREFQARHMEPVYSKTNVVLYRVRV